MGRPGIWSPSTHPWIPFQNIHSHGAAAMTEILEERPFGLQYTNVYLSIFILFCFKLFVKISLNILTHFYVVKGNRKEAARIAEEFYDFGQGHRKLAYCTCMCGIHDYILYLGWVLPYYCNHVYNLCKQNWVIEYSYHKTSFQAVFVYYVWILC